MKDFNNIKLADKQELAKYLLNNWSYNDEEQEKEELESAYYAAIEAISNGRFVDWTKTPSIEADKMVEELACND